MPYQYLTGWPVTVSHVEARPRIVELRASGYSWQRIASRLNVDGIRTPTGHGRWHAASVYSHANPPPRTPRRLRRDLRARRRAGL